MQYNLYRTNYQNRCDIGHIAQILKLECKYKFFLETIFFWIRGVLEEIFWLNKADFSEIVLHAGNIWLLYKGREWVTKIKQLSIAGHRK